MIDPRNDPNTEIREWHNLHLTAEQKRIAALEARVSELEALIQATAKNIDRAVSPESIELATRQMERRFQKARIAELEARVAKLEAQRVKPFCIEGGPEPVQMIQFAKKVGIRVRYDGSVKAWHFGEGDE